MDRKLIVALVAELFGTFFFQLFGGTEQTAAYNGLLLTVCIIFTAKPSGGHLNPAVSVGLCITGAIKASHAALYCSVQVVGAIIASLLSAGVDLNSADVPHGLSSWADDNAGPGCRAALPTPAYGAVFVLELAGTFLLVSTICAAAVAKPGFGDAAPFAIGLSIFVSVGAVGSITGGFFNPARFLGPAIVYGCNLQVFWLYLLAQFIGGALGGAMYRFVFATPTTEPLLVKSAPGTELASQRQ